jgi:hypothetical protein
MLAPGADSASAVAALAEEMLFATAERRAARPRQVRGALMKAERNLGKCEARLAGCRDSDRVVGILDEEHHAGGFRYRADAAR